MATLDHLTKGRVGWNVVSSYLDSAAKNLLNGESLPPHAERYERAQEYIDVVYKLFLSSWSDDAVELKNRVFTNPDKVREINHKGNFSLFLDLVLPNQLHKGYLLLFKLVLQKQVRSLLPEMLKLCLSQRFLQKN